MKEKIEPPLYGRDGILIDIPELQKDKKNLLILTAALNGIVEKDTGIGHDNITCLKEIGNEHFNGNIKKFIIPFLLKFELSTKRKIPNLSAVVTCLVKRGAEYAGALFYQAINMRLLKGLIDAGVQLTENQYGYTVLHTITTMTNHFDWKESMRLALAHGVDCNSVETSRGMGTALHLAMANEGFDGTTNQAQAKYLIDQLIAYPYNWDLKDGEGKTILILAAKLRATDVLEKLLSIRRTEKLAIDLDAQDNQGRTALHFCSALGNLAAVVALYQAGALINKHDNNGKDVLAYAALDESSVRKILQEIHIDPERDEKALHNYFIDIEYQPIYTGENCKENHFKATKVNAESILSTLIPILQLRKYDDENVKAYDERFIQIQCQLTGRSLIQACQEGQKDVITFLTTRRDNKKLIEAIHQTHFTKTGFEENLQDMINKTTKHVNTHSKDKAFLTSLQQREFAKALRQACAEGRITLVTMLLDFLDKWSLLKDQINGTSSNGKTALHWAAAHASKTNDMRVVELLIHHGADTTIMDGEKKVYEDYLAQKNTSQLQL